MSNQKFARKLSHVLVSALLGASLFGLHSSAYAASLPDFTPLVEKNSAAVVNISTERRVQPRGGAGSGRENEMEEFLRRFFPPDRIPRERDGRSLGSGFIISDDGYVLTNHHVVDGADVIKVRLNDRRELDAELVGSDRRSDLALLKLDADDLPVVKIGRSADLKVGEWVLAIGAPFGFDYSVTAGIVSAKGRSLPTRQNDNYVPFIQTDVAINPGNSGGPLFNLDGEVVGINSQIYSNSGGFMGVSFAIPIDVAMEVIEQLRDGGEVSRGWLGVVIQEVSRDLAESFGLDRPRGALISDVLSDSPAERGGLQEGDIITAFNGNEINRSGELPHYVGRAPANEDATLEVVRNGKVIEIELEIGELTDSGTSTLASDGGDESNAGKVGLVVAGLDPAELEQRGIEGGVRVTEVSGPAAAAGIRRGDVILALDNQTITSVADFRRVTAEFESGLVPVYLQRGESKLFIPLRIE